MKNNSVVFIAFRFFFGRKSDDGSRDQARKALLGATLSIALSLIPLITVMQVSEGMIYGISSRYIELSTYHAQIWSLSGNANVSLINAKRAALDSPGITGAWIETQTVAVAFANGKTEGVSIRGVEQSFLEDDRTKPWLSLEAGQIDLSQSNDAIVGQAIAEKLNIVPGNIISIISIRRDSNSMLIPKVLIFKVKGIISAGYRDLDSQWIFINQTTAAKMFPPENLRSFVGVKSDEPLNNPNKALECITGSLPPAYTAYSWHDIERNLFESLASTKNMLLLIMAVTVAVAAINISSALTTLVLERGHEIAVLKSIGADSVDIARVFSFGAIVLGGIGAVIGCMGGIITSLNINAILAAIEKFITGTRMLISYITGTTTPVAYKILDPKYYLENIPVNIAFNDIANIIVLTIFLSFIAAIAPARLAGKLTPIDSFRKH